MRNIIALAALAAAVLPAAASQAQTVDICDRTPASAGTPSWRRLEPKTAPPWIPKVWRALKT